jgi:nitrogen-specific signal transduction histidine kinase
VNIYTRKQRWKKLLLILALLISAGSLWYTNRLVIKLQEEEKKKIEIWAKATERFSSPTAEFDKLQFEFEIIKDNSTVPVILTNDKSEVLSTRNLDSIKSLDPAFVKEQLAEMKAQHAPIEINFAENEKNFIYYKDSTILTQLKYYPYFQLLVIALFLFVSYLAFSTSRKAEQNQVWVGMAKETAHQLGTPLSSLIAWLEIIKGKSPDDEFVIELEKDVQRLSTITDRFSKIGSAPALKKENLTTVIENAIGYIRTRSSSKVIFSLENAQQYNVEAPLNIALFDWVLENIFKNAIDAMSGEGNIHVKITDQQQFAYIDISDTGKGIPKSKYKDVFKPGFTSKSRGWGLGLSLSKRIVEEYHEGQIFVKSSELNKGTTFRIVLKKITT